LALLKSSQFRGTAILAVGKIGLLPVAFAPCRQAGCPPAPQPGWLRPVAWRALQQS